MEWITSKDNARVKQYVRLRDAKSARDAQKLFCVEGVKLGMEALSSGLEIACVFVTERAQNDHAELRRALENRREVYLISEPVAQKLAGTQTPQGLFCLCRCLDKPMPLSKIDHGGLFVLLCGIRDPGNLGTILRTADGLGADGVLLTEDCCDLYNPKVVRSTMGSLLRMPLRVLPDAAAFLRALSPRVETVAAVVDSTARPPQALRLSDAPRVLLIGNEGSGLPPELVSLCRHKTMIPMRGGAESFNAAVAAGILMWTLLPPEA